MDNKLSELSKPVAQAYYDEYDSSTMLIDWLVDYVPEAPTALYSQEYVSALIQRAERLDSILTESVQALKAVEQRNAELEAKMATPVQLPKPCAFNLCDLVDRHAVIASLREQGLTVERDE
ncbi:hypothetical protein ACJ8OA_06245 [Serratia sp. CY68630]|uniref:hypothetical protein n=1 Tax=Serratia sp. CY68630 TaxID=3383666 RepID=UPI003FA1690D